MHVSLLLQCHDCREHSQKVGIGKSMDFHKIVRVKGVFWFSARCEGVAQWDFQRLGMKHINTGKRKTQFF